MCERTVREPVFVKVWCGAGGSLSCVPSNKTYGPAVEGLYLTPFVHPHPPLPPAEHRQLSYVPQRLREWVSAGGTHHAQRWRRRLLCPGESSQRYSRGCYVAPVDTNQYFSAVRGMVRDHMDPRWLGHGGCTKVLLGIFVVFALVRRQVLVRGRARVHVVGRGSVAWRASQIGGHTFPSQIGERGG